MLPSLAQTDVPKGNHDIDLFNKNSTFTVISYI